VRSFGGCLAAIVVSRLYAVDVPTIVAADPDGDGSLILLVCHASADWRTKRCASWTGAVRAIPNLFFFPHLTRNFCRQ